MIDEPFEQLHLPDILRDLHADLYLNPTFSVPAIKTTAAQIAIVHDVVFEDHPEWVDPPLADYLRRASRFAAAHADRLITVSDHSRQRICAVYGIDPSRVTRIYNGLSTEAFERPSAGIIADMRRQFGIVGPFLLFLGTIEIKKGIRELLDAFARFCRSGGQGTLVLAGGQGGPAFDLAEAIRQTGVPERIVHLGYVEERWKKPLLADADLLVYPSLYEGFGMPPLEAMALGVPALVNDATSLPEVVGDTGLRVPVADGGAFAQALHRGLTDDRFRARARQAGPDRARQSFDRETLAAQYLDACEATLAAAVV